MIEWININDALPEQKIDFNGNLHSDYVLVWDSFFGPSIDRLWEGEWSSDRKARKEKIIEPAVLHYKTHWAYINKPKEVK